MAVSNYRVLQAFTAGADLSAGAGLVVKLNGSGQAVVAAAATDPAVGIIVDGGPQDSVIGVCTDAGSKVPARASAAIAVGARVGVVAGGKIATAATNTIGIGVALEAATAADQIITILYTGPTPAVA